MANGKFVAYYRVSTSRQGQSGLGLEAQQKAVADYLNGGEWEIIESFTEVESGKRSDRPKLLEAIAICKKYRATLIIAKLDRLTRNVHFISGLMEAGIEFIAVDNPNANKLMIHMLAAFAEHERNVPEMPYLLLKHEGLNWGVMVKCLVSKITKMLRHLQRD